MQTLVINFSHYQETLFSGRKNGERARNTFDIRFSEKIVVEAREDQLITSSYFLGLLSPELKRLVSEENGNVNRLLEHLNTESLNLKSKDECVRAIKRSITAPRSLMDL